MLINLLSPPSSPVHTLVIYRVSFFFNLPTTLQTSTVQSAWVERSLVLYSDLSMALSEKESGGIELAPPDPIFSPKHLYKITPLSIVFDHKISNPQCIFSQQSGPCTLTKPPHNQKIVEDDEDTSCRIYG